jgi:hypothetical protein
MRRDPKRWVTGLVLASGLGLGLASVGVRPAHAELLQTLPVTWQSNFEGAAANMWWPASTAGVETGSAQAHTGTSDGLAAGLSGWNAINAAVTVTVGTPCQLEAWVKGSSDLTDGYVSVRSFAQGLPGLASTPKLVGVGQPVPGHNGYHREILHFVADASPVLFYAGQWGNGKDSWLRVDDVKVSCVSPTCVPRTCDDVGASCGKIDDLCGGQDDCGRCETGDICRTDHQCHVH